MRLPNRYGTVYKLSGKNRRRPYVAKAFLHNDDGKSSVYYNLGYFSTKQEAIASLVAYHEGRFSFSKNMTLKTLYNEWSAVHYKTIAASTIRQYEAAWKRLEKLKNLPVSEIRTSCLQSIITESAGKLKRGSLEKIKILAVMLFDYAEKNDICQKNYAKYLTLPKKEKTEKSVFSRYEIDLLWKNLTKPYADSIIFMVYTGFRVGEMLALCVCDVDISGGFIKGGIKTSAGKNRLVPIHPKIKKIVYNHIKNKSESALLFDVSYRKYYSEFKKLMQSLGIENKTPHCCRHTFATNMAKGGADVNALKTIIGHSSYATTADIYTHLGTEELAKAITALT